MIKKQNNKTIKSRHFTVLKTMQGMLLISVFLQNYQWLSTMELCQHPFLRKMVETNMSRTQHIYPRAHNSAGKEPSSLMKISRGYLHSIMIKLTKFDPSPSKTAEVVRSTGTDMSSHIATPIYLPRISRAGLHRTRSRY